MKMPEHSFKGKMEMRVCNAETLLSENETESSEGLIGGKIKMTAGVYPASDDFFAF